MSEEVKIMRKDVIALYDTGCSDVKEALKVLFPDVFEKEWKNITGLVKWVAEDNGNGHYFLNGWYEGHDMFFISQRQHREGTVISFNDNEIYDIKIKYDGDTHSIFIRDRK